MYSIETIKKDITGIKEWLMKEYVQLQTGRASPSFLDSVYVDVYGAQQPLKNVASVSIEDPKTLRVVPWDKSQIKDIERAVHLSNMGFSVSVDDQGIRIIIPPLTTERRVSLAKIAKERLEDARISIRKARESMLSSLKDSDLSEDMHTRAKTDVQKCVDEANAEVEALFKKKESEITN